MTADACDSDSRANSEKDQQRRHQEPAEHTGYKTDGKAGRQKDKDIQGHVGYRQIYQQPLCPLYE